MKRVTIDEIEEMRARGFDSATIDDARDAYSLGVLADKLIARIEEAFDGVVLGDGVGLREAGGLDDHEDEATCAAYRENDEKENWKKIAPESLYDCLSFFDPEGMRFHLPAFLRADLQGKYDYGLTFCLTHLDEHGRGYFTALNAAQRQAVRAYLEFLKDDPNCTFDKPDIDRALREFWTDYETPDYPLAEQ